MRLVPLERCDQDVVLARSVTSERADGAPLLRAGTIVTRELAARIAATGNRAIWVDDELGRDISPPPEFPAAVIGVALDAASRALGSAPGAIAAGRELDAELVDRLGDAAAEIAAAVLEYPPDLCPISDLPVALATAPWHALRVALLGAFIGRRALLQGGWIDFQGVQRFDLVDERLTTLAFGLLVHDIGAPAPSLQRGAHACMIAESDQPVEHVGRGAGLFAPESTPAEVRVVIRSHHERWDGLGYPERKHRDATPLNARIAAIADAFDAVIATGDERQPLVNHAAVAWIEEGAGRRFDPALVAHFSALVAPYPLGHEVPLGDGREGVVAQLPRGDRLHPTVRLRSASGPIVELVADLAGEQARAA